MKIMLDTATNIRHSKVTKDSKSAWLGGYLEVLFKAAPSWELERDFAMYDLFIALVFVAMVAAPVIVASSYKTADKHDC